MSKEIIISVNEADTLIHKGSLILSRDNKTRRSNTYRVIMILNKEIGLSEDTKSVVLYSDVKEFEVYSLDEIVFINHFRVPLGMLKVIKKTYKINKESIENEPAYIDNGGYLKLRNGLLGMLHHKYEMQSVLGKEYRIEGILQSFFNLSDVRKQLIIELLSKDEFPIMEINTDKYMSDISKRIVWWGKFLRESYLEKEIFERIINLGDKKVNRAAKIKQNDNKVVSESGGQLGLFNENNIVDELKVSTESKNKVKIETVIDLPSSSKSEKGKVDEKDIVETAASDGHISNKSNASKEYAQKIDKANLRIKEIRVWLGKFMKIGDVDLINCQLVAIPEEIREEVDFIVGYCLAATYYDKYQGDESVMKQHYNLVVYENKDELYSWVSFFISLFRQDMHQLYFIRPLKAKVNQLERLAFELSQNNLTAENKENFNEEQVNLNKDDLITEYFNLMKGVDGRVKTEIITEKEAKDVFKNNLFEDQLPMVGMEKISDYDDIGPIKNFCMLSNNEITISYQQLKGADVVFYLDKNSKMADEMKAHNFKVKDVGALIDLKKRALLVFNQFNKKSSFISLYAELLNGNRSSKVEKAIIILFVNTMIGDIRSLEFSNELKQIKSDYQGFFGLKKVEVIVKDIHSADNTEVKRNLKNALRDYKINQIEVIDENFDNEKATWILDINSEYLVEKANQNYYSFFN